MHILKPLVITLGVLILIALGILVYGIATKFNGTGVNKGVESTFGETHVLIPAGSKIIETSYDGGNIIVRLKKTNGEEALLLINGASGKIAGLVHLIQGPPK